ILFHTRPVNGGAPLTLGLAFDVSGYRAGAAHSGAATSPAASASAGPTAPSPAQPPLVNSGLLERLAAALREPLTPLLAVSRVMRLRAQASPSLGHSSEVIERQASHLAMLSEDLQDVVQLSAAPPEPALERTDFTEIVRGS